MNAPSTIARHTLRNLMRNRVFTIVAVSTLGLGIGAATAVFTVVNGILLRPLGFPAAERIVQLFEVSDRGQPMSIPEANFADWQAGSRSFEAMAIFASSETAVLGGNEPVRARVAVVSSGFFDVLKVRPVVGRAFRQDSPEPIGRGGSREPGATGVGSPSHKGDDAPRHEPNDHGRGAEAVAIVSYGFWQRLMKGDVDLTGAASLTFSNRAHTVVGVMPPSFQYPPGTEVWAPAEPMNPFIPSRSAHNWSAIARLKSETGVDQARAELSAIAKRIRRENADVTAVDATAVPLLEAMTGRVRLPLLVLLGAVGGLLLVACANVTHLLFERTLARERELAVRAALGASRTAIVVEVLAETVFLSLIGGGIGIFLSSTLVRVLLALGSGRLPRSGEVRVDGAVLAFALAVSLVTALAIGLFSALRIPLAALQNTLRQAGRSEAGVGSQRTARRLLVISQVGVTVVLLVGTGLLAKSFFRILGVELGFSTAGRLTVDLSAPFPRDDSERTRLAQFHERLEERLRAIPGVADVGGINALPLTRTGGNGRFLIENRGDSGNYWPDYRAASPGYFTSMGIPLVRGRFFDETDSADTPQVALISTAVAERIWPGEDPIGRRINTGNMDGDNRFMTIVGVVGDVRQRGADGGVNGTIYAHFLQRPQTTSSFTLVILTAGEPSSLLTAVRQEVHAVNPETPVRLQTFDAVFASSLTDRRFNLTLLSAFGAAALVLALIGIYGVVAYSVAQRMGEIGVRMALGAQPLDVVRLFVRDGARDILAGIVIGLLGALAAGRVLSSLLFEVSPRDPSTLVAVALSLALVALLACYVPARRATHVDPLVTLRSS